MSKESEAQEEYGEYCEKCNKKFLFNHVHCPKCGSLDHELRNYNLMWHDGDVYCSKCGGYVRGYDAG